MTTPGPVSAPSPPPPGSASSPARWQRVGILAGAILLATWAAYANSFRVPFIFDDLRSVTSNPSIWHLSPLKEVLSPPPGLGVSGRPLVNLSLALNYAVGGEGVEVFVEDDPPGSVAFDEGLFDRVKASRAEVLVRKGSQHRDIRHSLRVAE